VGEYDDDTDDHEPRKTRERQDTTEKDRPQRRARSRQVEEPKRDEPNKAAHNKAQASGTYERVTDAIVLLIAEQAYITREDKTIVVQVFSKDNKVIPPNYRQEGYTHIVFQSRMKFGNAQVAHSFQGRFLTLTFDSKESRDKAIVELSALHFAVGNGEHPVRCVFGEYGRGSPDSATYWSTSIASIWSTTAVARAIEAMLIEEKSPWRGRVEIRQYSLHGRREDKVIIKFQPKLPFFSRCRYLNLKIGLSQIQQPVRTISDTVCTVCSKDEDNKHASWNYPNTSERVLDPVSAFYETPDYGLEPGKYFGELQCIIVNLS
jgi:hypothetical protein